jgi:branched-chain amino acid transport system permease protein
VTLQRRLILWIGAAAVVAAVLGMLIDDPKRFFTFLVIGLVTGSVYAVAASGLVVTYTTSGIFNFAHGAIGMVMAFVYWQINVAWHVPAFFAFILVVFVIAPLFGALVERILMRNLQGASVATSVVITLGLLVLLIGFAQSEWSPATSRSAQPFFGKTQITLFGVNVSGHQIFSLVVAIAAAGVLYFVLNRTRVGLAMRAVVDDRNLVALNGAAPNRVSMLSWAMGSSLAALAGVLLAPTITLNIIVLTLLVINAYAAAVVGGLKSLPRTFVGAFALGLLVEFYHGFGPSLSGTLGSINRGFNDSLPIVFLFVALLFLPEARLRAGRLVGAKSPRVPSLKESIAAAVALVVVAWVATSHLAPGDQSRAGKGLVFAMIMLTFIPLTGYAGQVSLAQLSLAGMGAFAAAKVGTHLGFGPAILAAAALAGVVGIVFALPALRLQGLYLALTTLAFAKMLDYIFFGQSYGFGAGGSLLVKRPSVFHSEEAFILLTAAAFGAMGVLVLALKRGPFGRRLAAMRDSPAACATLGLDLTRTKLAVFALAAAMAGIAGVFYAAQQGTAGNNDFLMEQGLPILLLAVVGGITTVSGALLGGLLYGLRPLLEQHVPSLPGVTSLVVGLATVSLARNPNGIAFWLSERLGHLLPRRRTAGPPRPARPPGLREPEVAPMVTT